MTLFENTNTSNPAHDNAAVSCWTIGVTEFARQMGIGRNQAYALVHQRNFPVIKIGGSYRVVTSQIDDWLKSNIGNTYHL
jgi:excisionase family DNA binding protein